MKIKQIYQLITVSLLLTMVAVKPLSAQSAPTATPSASPCLTANQTDPRIASLAGISTGPDNAGAPLDCWVGLDAHQWHWYKFRYGYNARTDNPPHQAYVELMMNSASCISFELWTPERLKAKEDDPSLGPVGTGSPKFMPVDPKSGSSKNLNQSTLLWSGSQAGSSTFYVIVKNRTDAACTYHLSITGKSVFYLKPKK
ncbi:MAG: hypothetical protein NT075_22020 [Chloroflexi bacterium]|nr:hypothetical protein [Chloroflexota bacterium]